jgi:hypothetical protein
VYKIFRSDRGKVEAIYHQDGRQMLFDPSTQIFVEDHPWTIELRDWEQDNGELDLSDLNLTPVELNNYRLNFLVEPDRNIPLFRYPGDINYGTDLMLGLSTERLDYFGLRVANILYQTLDTVTLKPLPKPIPVVLEKYLYFWDKATNLPISRIKEIRFYFDDGTLDSRKKLLPKEFYNTSDRADICNKRRESIVAWLIARSVELGLGDALKGFFANYKDECDKYILYGDRSIVSLVNSSTEPWMEADTTTQMGTVRNAIAFCFDKALEATPDKEIEAFLRITNY